MLSDYDAVCALQKKHLILTSAVSAFAYINVETPSSTKHSIPPCSRTLDVGNDNQCCGGGNLSTRRR